MSCPFLNPHSMCDIATDVAGMPVRTAKAWCEQCVRQSRPRQPNHVTVALALKRTLFANRRARTPAQTVLGFPWWSANGSKRSRIATHYPRAVSEIRPRSPCHVSGPDRVRSLSKCSPPCSARCCQSQVFSVRQEFACILVLPTSFSEERKQRTSSKRVGHGEAASHTTKSKLNCMVRSCCFRMEEVRLAVRYRNGLHLGDPIRSWMNLVDHLLTAMIHCLSRSLIRFQSRSANSCQIRLWNGWSTMGLYRR